MTKMYDGAKAGTPGSADEEAKTKNPSTGGGSKTDDLSAGGRSSQALVQLLKDLSELPGPSGQEDAVAIRIGEALEPYCHEVRRDSFGNVIGLARGEAADPVGPESGGLAGDESGAAQSRRPRMMFAAHSDEIGLIVTKVDKGGFLRFTSVGGIDARAIVAQQVTVLTDPPLTGYVGIKPPHITTPEEREKVIPVEDMFIDVGMPEDMVKERVRVGDMAVVRRQFTELLGGRVTGKALDNRAGVAAMVEAMRLLSRLKHGADVIPVATVQEEVGLRGAIVSAYDIVPDMAIAVDVGFAGGPGIPESRSIAMGKGPAIALGANIHPRLHKLLVDTAKEYGIPYQIEPMPGASGTDGWALQVVRGGIPTAVVSIPLRSMHTSVEVVDVEDVRNTARLLAHVAAALTEADAEGWSYALT